MLRRRRGPTSDGHRLSDEPGRRRPRLGHRATLEDLARQQRIDALVAEAASRLEAGGLDDDPALECAHPELMPELGQRLADLRLLRQAAERVRQTPDEPLPVDPHDEVLAEELAVLRQSLDEYEVLSRVRRGGQGVVYRARQRGTNRLVALKLLLDGPLATERQRHLFEREIELVSRLRHPNIVTVYESGCVRGRLFCAMEFIAGLPIDDYVILHDLPPRDIVALLIKVCRAIHHAHQNGIIHRDLNPSNILVDEQDEPRVYDFGLAKDLWTADEGARASSSGVGIGTLPYLSPEQAGGLDGKVDVRSDTYALGVVLYELLTDVLPYAVRGAAPTVRRVIVDADPLPLRKAVSLGGKERAPSVAAINRDLEAVVDRALAKRKEDRYQSAAALADDLERWLQGDAVAARTGSRLYAARKTVRRHAVAFTIGGVVLAASAVSAIVTTVSWLQVRQQRDSARQAARVAYELFDVALTDVEESVRPLAGGVAVRDRLLRRLSDKLPQLQTLAEADQALEPVVTRLSEKEGDIAKQQGRRAEARRLFQEFLGGSLRRARQETADGIWRSDVIRAYRKLAEVSDDRAAVSERGVAEAEQLVAAAPQDDDARYELCRLLLSYTFYLHDEGQFDQALRRVERALALCPAPAEATSIDRRWTPVLALALNVQGMALHAVEGGTRGEEVMLRSLELREQIVAQAPADTEARLALLGSYGQLASVYEDAGQRGAAKDYLRKATEHADLLAALDPSATGWDRERYGMHHRLAELYLGDGELEQARPCCQKAVAIAEAWAARESSTDSQSTLAYSLILRGGLSMAEANWPAARDSFEHALSLRQKLLDAEPASLSRLADLIDSHTQLASCFRRLKDLPQQLKHCEAECALQDRLAAQQPEAIDTALRSINARLRLVVAHLQVRTQEHDALAEGFLNQAKAALEDLAATGKLGGWEAQRQAQLKCIAEYERELHERRAAEAGQPPQPEGADSRQASAVRG